MSRSTRLALCLGALVIGAASSAALADGDDGSVYTLTNETAGNRLVTLHRADNGGLALAGTLTTGGLGSGTGLGNQGALILSGNGRTIYAVNAGSRQISVFLRTEFGPALLQVVDSGAARPISLAQRGHLLYVLNAAGAAGGADGITGFVVGPGGLLAPLAGSTRPLSAASTGPAQISFTPNGSKLVVTEKATSLIDTFDLGSDGRVTGSTAMPSVGMTPFGFAFSRQGYLIVSEAFGGAAGASAVSSYARGPAGFGVVSASVPTNQTAACWIVGTRNSRFFYTTNTGSDTVSGFALRADTGELEPLDGGAPVATGAGPIDASIVDNRFLFILARPAGQIDAFRIAPNGSLSPLPGVSGLPTSANGLAAD